MPEKSRTLLIDADPQEHLQLGGEWTAQRLGSIGTHRMSDINL
jgi:hypothetical protein